MRRVLFAMLLVAAPHGVSDLTWDFAEGWAAQESSATATMVSSESMVSSARLDADSTQSQPSVVIITGEVRDPRSREITFRYESLSALESPEQRVALDSLDRFALELPVVRGTLVWGYFEGGQPRWKWVQWLGSFLFDRKFLTLFVEPGDSLHVAVEEGFFVPSYSFSGSNADNSRFTSEWFPRFGFLRLDYEGLELEEFSRRMEQQRRDQLEFLAERREQYALSSGCIDYVTAYVNYEWATRMMSYPTAYRFANKRKNRDITPEYYDFLQEFPLVNEKAIGVRHYREFVESTLGWEDHNEFRMEPPQAIQAVRSIGFGVVGGDPSATRLPVRKGRPTARAVENGQFVRGWCFSECPSATRLSVRRGWPLAQAIRAVRFIGVWCFGKCPSATRLSVRKVREGPQRLPK